MTVDSPWDSEASLMRVTRIDTAQDQFEELVARGTVYELVGQALEMTPEQQQGLMIRAAGEEWTCEFDEAAIRELAARPEFIGSDNGDQARDTEERRSSELNDEAPLG